MASWIALLAAFRTRGRKASFSVYLSVVRIVGHPEEGPLPNSIPEEKRSALREQILSFDESEVVELLHFVDDNGFERGGAGYGLFAILPNITDHISILNRIRSKKGIQENIRESAALLVAIRNNDPDWWELWKRSKR